MDRWPWVAQPYDLTDKVREKWSHHVWPPRSEINYHGVEATLDAHSFNLQRGQLTEGGVWVISRGDGKPSSVNGIQLGWHIHPGLYKDSHTHFYVAWGVKKSRNKGCFNMVCPGFKKTSSNTAPGDVIPGNKPSITIRILKDKNTGDWNVYYGLNRDSPKKVGYFPRSLLPGMIDKPVELRFGGYVSHEKPTPSPPMGNGYVPSSGNAASINSLNFIDGDGIYHAVNEDLPYVISREQCYSISNIDHGRFFYGGPGCSD
ncbi:uncharacterized protein LOC124695406 [Lolium rigidum]|uniref:uncharacterized protein LOC124695406 n=1 Tax=Lolium rigidum TaxID=89674 RepID=UPI001F5CEB5D|nr:uncharacterized protein LOC124695406 [Lolium rigidum]